MELFVDAPATFAYCHTVEEQLLAAVLTLGVFVSAGLCRSK